MKKNNFIVITILLLFIISCTPNGDIQNPVLKNKVPKLISETNSWHVLSGQKFPLSIQEIPVQLQYENGHLTQSFLGIFYAAQSSNATHDFARCNLNGDSVFVRQDYSEYNPFFYKEGDATDVRYGVFWAQEGAYSSHLETGLHGIGPDALDVDTKLFDFPKAGMGVNSYKYFANPFWLLFYDPYYAGLKAYRIGTAKQIEIGGFYQNDYVMLNGIMGLDIDETYCKANPEHVKAYFASSNTGADGVNYSINGHASNYISFYSADDLNKTVFRDSTSQYYRNNTGTLQSCSDVNKVYFFANNATDKSDPSNTNPRLLMFVFDKTTLKLTNKIFIGTGLKGILSDVNMISSKNLIFLNTTSNLYKLDLSNNSIVDITPPYLSGTYPHTVITVCNNKLYAIVGSGYTPGQAAFTNVIYFE